MIALIAPFEGVSKTRTLILLFALWPVLYAAIAGVLLHVVQTPYRILNVGPVIWLGRISYSLYLWQQIFVFDRRPRPWYFILFAIGAASLSYYLVERPMLQLREKRASTKTRTPQFLDLSPGRHAVVAATVEDSGS
jgi:peptidoglycan/LPS O-acetylase OafA/YrhL